MNNENNLENIVAEVRDDGISILVTEYNALHSKHTFSFCSICYWIAHESRKISCCCNINLYL